MVPILRWVLWYGHFYNQSMESISFCKYVLKNEKPKTEESGSEKENVLCIIIRASNREKPACGPHGRPPLPAPRRRRDHMVARRGRPAGLTVTQALAAVAPPRAPDRHSSPSTHYAPCHGAAVCGARKPRQRRRTRDYNCPRALRRRRPSAAAPAGARQPAAHGGALRHLRQLLRHRADRAHAAHAPPRRRVDARGEAPHDRTTTPHPHLAPLVRHLVTHHCAPSHVWLLISSFSDALGSRMLWPQSFI